MNTHTTSTLPPKIQSKVMSVVKDEIPDIEAKEQEALQMLEQIKQQKKQALEKAVFDEKKRLDSLRAKRKDLLEQVKKMDEMSLKALTHDDKLFYAQESIEAQNEADEIAMQLPESFDAMPDTHERVGFFEKLLSSVGTVWGALSIFVIVAIVSNIMVFKIADEINTINKLAQDAGNLSQMVPPSIGKMSFQKGWFTWMTISIDLIALILIMALIAPDKLFFLLPFTKSSVKAWKPFSNQPEEQKQWQAFAYVALILLFLAISHLGGK